MGLVERDRPRNHTLRPACAELERKTIQIPTQPKNNVPQPQCTFYAYCYNENWSYVNANVEHEECVIIAPFIFISDLRVNYFILTYVRRIHGIKVIYRGTCVKSLLHIHGTVVESRKFTYATRINHAQFT